jgi:hypothetical protein
MYSGAAVVERIETHQEQPKAQEGSRPLPYLLGSAGVSRMRRGLVLGMYFTDELMDVISSTTSALASRPDESGRVRTKTDSRSGTKSSGMLRRRRLAPDPAVHIVTKTSHEVSRRASPGARLLLPVT